MARLLNLRALLALAISMATVAALGALALASGGGEDDGVFAIELGDGAIGTEAPTIASGRQVVAVTNVGSREHEVILVRTRRAPGAIPVGLHGVSPSLAGRVLIGEDHAAAGHRHSPETILGLRQHESQRHQVELAPGAYVVLCQTDNHYLEGERAAIEER